MTVRVFVLLKTAAAGGRVSVPDCDECFSRYVFSV